MIDSHSLLPSWFTVRYPMNMEVAPQRLELLHALVPSTSIIGLLVHPSSPSLAQSFERAVMAAARAPGRELHVLQASNERDIEIAFSSFGRLRVDGLVIVPEYSSIAGAQRLPA